MKSEFEGRRVAVVIPSFKVTRHVLAVLSSIPEFVSHIFVVDDACPEGSGRLVEQKCQDPRVCVLYSPQNEGVGGATLKGFEAAARSRAEVIVKIDGDGQMDARLLPQFIAPILQGRADYCKGNRFFDLEATRQMPALRLFGNAVLSFMIKMSSGYWNLFDPTNGFIAMDARLMKVLPVDKVEKRYFFESDLLFRLGTLRAVVLDIPMQARYGDEVSNLKVRRILLPFLLGHMRNTAKRLVYNYFLRDFTIASVNLVMGMALILAGAGLGAYKWWALAGTGSIASSGTVMLAALPIIIGFQLLLSALNYDIQNVPKEPVGRYLPDG